jgi:hypothetical protein
LATPGEKPFPQGVDLRLCGAIDHDGYSRVQAEIVSAIESHVKLPSEAKPSRSFVGGEEFSVRKQRHVEGCRFGSLCVVPQERRNL